MAVISIKKEENVKMKKYWIIIAILAILAFRIIPYINNSVPLGYDPGIYKYVIENPNAHDMWVKIGFEPGLFMITSFLKLIGISTNAILTYVFIFFELLLGITIYFTAKKFFNEQVGILAILLYAVSATQLKAFEFNYMKQVVGLILMLLSFYLMQLKDEKPSKSIYILLVAVASFLGGLHRPTFLIFGLVFIAYTVKDSYRNKKIILSNLKTDIILGVSILFFTILFYIGRIREALFTFLGPLATADIGSGTFIDLQMYQLLSLAYLPFALLGFFFLIKKRKFNIAFLWFLINGIIVYFRIIFFNRYIISLDIVMIILAAYGLYLLLQNRTIGTIAAILLIASSGYIVFLESRNATPLIDKDELGVIESLSTTIEPNAFVMSTDGEYSPWLQGYSGRRVIAPGLFDYDNWTRDEWELFWNNPDITQNTRLLDRYQKPLYLFIGRIKPKNEAIFNNSCFKQFLSQDKTIIYSWLC
ncbi:MAG: glycosyltransferase family 39 protein [Candidatus Woesearchaeota archaeon]|nr:glycosyltransferase family 39 protein [Candidatus Woesearchaeota archaeon]